MSGPINEKPITPFVYVLSIGIFSEDANLYEYNVLGVYSTRERAENESKRCAETDPPETDICYEILEKQIDVEVIII